MRSLTVDGEAIEGNLVPLAAAGETVRVEVVLGPLAEPAERLRAAVPRSG